MRNVPTNQYRRASLAAVLCATALLANVNKASAQDYPKRSIALHVTHEADGNTSNQIGGAMQQSLSARLGVDVAVATPKHRAGKAAAQVVSAGASGYQVMVANAQSHLFKPVLTNDKASGALPLLGLIVSSPMLCIVNAKLSVNTMADLIAKVKSDSKFRVSSAGKSSHSHVTAQLALRAAGATVRLNHLGLKSPAAALAAVLKGTAQFACVPATLAMQFIKRRQLKPLMASSPVAGIDVPTAKDLGFSGFDVLDEFIAVAASERVKEVVVNAWQPALTQLSQNKDFVANVTQLGFRVGREQLMLRAQANAVLAKRQAELRDLLARYGLEPG